MSKQEIVFYRQPRKIKIRSQKGNLIKRTTARYHQIKEIELSNQDIDEAMDFLGGSHVLKPYSGTNR